MDPLTSLLAAAAANGPNAAQTQALAALRSAALRSAGPQESFYTRMGNPHPLQTSPAMQSPTTQPTAKQPTAMQPTAMQPPTMQPAMLQPPTMQPPTMQPSMMQPTMMQPSMTHMGPTMPQFQQTLPIHFHPTPTSIQPQFHNTTLPFPTAPIDPVPTNLHIPTLQTIQRMQQQTNPATRTVRAAGSTGTSSNSAYTPTQGSSAIYTGQLPLFDSATIGSVGAVGGTRPTGAAWQCAQGLAVTASSAINGDTRPRRSHQPGPKNRHCTPRNCGATNTDQIPRRRSDAQSGPSNAQSKPPRRRRHQSSSRRRHHSPSRDVERRSRSRRGRRAHGHHTRTNKSASPLRRSRGGAFILRSLSQLGKLPIPDLHLNQEWTNKWSYRAPLPSPAGNFAANQPGEPSAPSRPTTETAAIGVQQGESLQEGPPTRFRPSSYSVDLSNAPPPQVMIKPAANLRREERPQILPHSISEAHALAQTLSEMGQGTGIPEQTYSESAVILLSSGKRDQALEMSSEVMSVSEGVHQVLFIPWAGRERTTFGMEEGETGSLYEYVFAHGTSPAGLRGILSEDLLRPSAQDIEIKGTEKVQATAVYGSATPGGWSHYALQTVLAQAIKRQKAYSHGIVICGQINSKYQHYKCDFRDTRKERAIVARRGLIRTPERWGFHSGHLTIKGVAIFAP